MPLRRNDFFSGRDELLVDLQKHLKPVSGRQSPVVVGLTGLGGVGKTQVSAEFAFRNRDDFSAVIWICANSQASIHQSVLDAMVGLGVHDSAVVEPERVTAAFMRWLRESPEWLLIFDNADDLDALVRYIPVAGAGSILVTTRVRNLDRIGPRHTIDLTEFLPDESLSFLLNRTRRSNASDAVRAATDNPA